MGREREGGASKPYLYQTRIPVGWETASTHQLTTKVPNLSRTPNQPQYDLPNDVHLRARFLRPLSMACKAIRLRFLRWVWNLIEPLRRGRDYAELTWIF